MSARGDARKRLAEQQDAPVSFTNRQSDTLVDKFLAYLYAQNTVNQYSRHAEPLARIAAEHYGAEVAAERERADAAEAKIADAWDEGHSVCEWHGLERDRHVNPYRAALGGEATP